MTDGADVALGSLASNLRFHGNDVDSSTLPVKHNMTFAKSEQGVILALTYVGTGVELVSNLTNENVSGDNVLATEFLDSTTLGV